MKGPVPFPILRRELSLSILGYLLFDFIRWDEGSGPLSQFGDGVVLVHPWTSAF